MSKTTKKQEAPTKAAGAKKPAPAAKPAPGTMEDIDDLAAQMGIPDWERQGLFRAAGWAPGKQVTDALFTTALVQFRARRMGAGKI
ncbi:hypothetical protein DO021_19635 [Desulfobacter hydrogenophilus]|uniref:Uncharacterized protein n=1 Tax=Desulfobacter hydrogenophilus TaxID=2291 RepID=A0A328F6Z1_9BACT|nr:hypothetical protein [Desulfobacter hydrogenophilus]NDY73984.1 hypothetical protein [Desulfobacter hydrogenophilus]QBH14329.1 hypothetical protein EYB58_16235 [Desulfobacter hydrogenophilus]RAM00331.1 hypothetical protein DO021_19635 [Desulfobacter hydrogenophilus]